MSVPRSGLESCMAQEYRFSFAVRHPRNRHALRPLFLCQHPYCLRCT